MKKYLLLLFIFCLQLVPAKAQWVTIPDANFASKLTQLFPTCMNGNQMDTTCSQIVNAIGLDVNNSFISDLTGISHFSNLTSLLCGYNQLTSLPTLPITLTNLQCYHNQLSSLPNLPPNLIYLGADYNQLNNLPQLPNTLQYLYCNDNQLTSLPVLPNSLIALKCQNNLLTNLPDLPLNLEDLICSNNQLNFLPSLPINLDELDCSFNYLTYLPQVPEYITFLIINDNNISCLYNVPDALFVGITNNPITCIPNDCFTFPLGLPLCIDDDPINNPNNCMSDFNISGNVYNDQNSNCLYDLSDLGTSNISLNYSIPRIH
jgi:Leucine-rich repeat (LRR) protein